MTAGRRRHHQPRRLPLAKIRPGNPAPAMGPGTAAAGMPSPFKVTVPLIKKRLFWEASRPKTPISARVENGPGAVGINVKSTVQDCTSPHPFEMTEKKGGLTWPVD